MGHESKTEVSSARQAKETQVRDAMTRYIEQRILARNESGREEEEKNIIRALSDKTASEKALRLYQYIVSFSLENQPSIDSSKKEKPDTGLLNRIRFLWNDESTKRLYLDTYSEARVDEKTFRLSDMGTQLTQKGNEIAALEEEYKKNKQALVLKTVTRPTAVAATRANLELAAGDLTRAISDREKVIALEGYELTSENTDVAAKVMFDTLMRYHTEAEAGFAWLPSRRKLHQQILDVIEGSGKAPLLIGPPGTGKTSQLDAVAQELTGSTAIRIPCNSTLGDEGLVAKRDVKGGEGAYDYEGCIAEAYTGFRHSNDGEPAHEHGRMVNLDEISQLNLEKALGPLKDIRQAKDGKPLNRYVRRPVLPGAGLSATSNLPITDERLDREFGRVPTNYFEMNEGNPELYEFMVSRLLSSDKSFPIISKTELEPAYEKIDVFDGSKVKDGRVIIGKEELKTDPTDTDHGILYRLSYAIRALQDSYIHGSKFNEKHLANTALYHSIDDAGNVAITGYDADLKAGGGASASGEMLRLTSGASTLTPEIISRWMKGFQSRMSSKNPKDHTKTLTAWIQLQLENHIAQTSPDDGERIRAILDYFHLFDAAPVDAGDSKPLTPKDVGYLSPRVPRPLHVETPVPEAVAQSTETKDSAKPVELYTMIEVSLEDGGTARVRKGKQSLRTKVSSELAVGAKTRFLVDGADYSFAGTLEDGGKPVGSFLEEPDLHKIFTSEQVEKGIVDFSFQKLEKYVEFLCEMPK